MKSSCASIVFLAISVIAPGVAGGQGRHVNGDFSVGAFVPVVDLGSTQGFDARLRPGVDLRLGAVLEGYNGPALRVAISLVPANATRVQPTSTCVSDCTERSVATWIVAPGADLLWRSGAAGALYLSTGVGLSMYARTTADCVDFVGQFCPSRFTFTKNAVRPAARLGVGWGGGPRHRLLLEADDYLTPINAGRMQNDLRLGVGARF